ncbi:hypothetical protein [Labrenzia sp. VG12]|uniref:hypothetical protein n=1 Tax=Labrenzia sp. VG12 TaxID=2021862 RepID=UPI000B8C2A87|nr:hypothetical protein [Labrenzia sp. VG12]ASP36339.1 hypothetical protein CHH27_26380 [Labrenzia sp. VG12]
MHIPALNRVECAILHDEFNPLDGTILFQKIEKLAIDLGYAAEVQLMITSTGKDIHVHAGGHRILVSQNDTPLGPDGFQSALTTPYTGFVFPDAREVVARHKANTFITIAKGILDTQFLSEKMREICGDDALAQMLPDESFCTLEEADRARTLCAELTKLLIGHNPASALHWCVSDNLVPQPLFERLTQDEDLTFLNIRPFLTSSSGQLGEGRPLGMFLHGSQWVIGKMIEFEEAPVPFSWMMEVVTNFIKMCQIRGSILPDRNIFSTEGEDWTVAVFHEKIDGHTAWEKVRLQVINAPQFGIHGDTTAKRSLKYDNEQDIRARAEEEQHEVHAANDPQPFHRRPDDPSGPSRQASPPGRAAAGANDCAPEPLRRANRQDMQALREFAKRASTQSQAAADPARKPNSLLAKARRLLGRQ